MNQLKIENIEVDLLLETIFQRYGYDFRSYAKASIGRRVRQFALERGYGSISDIIPRVIHDEEVFSKLVQHFSIPVTEMFRDPFVYVALREEVIPLLRTYPHIKVWHAGCATGEEVYSVAILFKEENIYDRTTIYATDFNDEALDKAKSAIYSPDTIQQATRNYQTAGGRSSFADYYYSCYDAVALDAALKERITFANHNLATDWVFGDMHLIICRNVLIYFNMELQDRVIGLFSESLVKNGFLCLGTRESLSFTPNGNRFEAVNEKSKLFRKKDFL